MVQVRTRPLLPDVVRSALRRAIIEGEFPPGSKLPNEEALCERFAVSRAEPFRSYSDPIGA